MMRLSLSMIVDDDEESLEACLEGAARFVDEIVVVDTGSTEGAQNVAADYGGRVYRLPDAQDPAHARNATLHRATSDWILCLDSDEMLLDDSGPQIKPFLSQLPTQVMGVTMRVAGPGTGSMNSEPRDELRLFRNHDRIVVENPIMDDVSPSLKQLGGQITPSDIRIGRRHVDDLTVPSVRERRLYRFIRRTHNSQEPQSADHLRQLGIAHSALGNFFHAECYLADYLIESQPDDEHHGAMARLLAKCYCELDDLERAQETCRRAMEASGPHTAWAEVVSCIQALANAESETHRTTAAKE